MNRPGFRAGKSTTPWKILDVRILSPTSAAVWSDERIEGVVPGTNAAPIPLRHSYYLEALTKRDENDALALVERLTKPDLRTYALIGILEGLDGLIAETLTQTKNSND